MLNDLSDDAIVEMPVDELALAMLRHALETNEWHENNYVRRREDSDVRHAMSEGLTWLRSRVLIATQPTKDAETFFVTRLGRDVLEQGRPLLDQVERLRIELHPLIHRKVSRQFMLGEYEQGVFVAFKAIEIRVRELGGFPADLVGVKLMNAAFDEQNGPLADQSLPSAEREGMKSLFRGTYAVLRNPSGHRDVDYDDITEAGEAVSTASMLMRVLDRVEARIKATAS